MDDRPTFGSLFAGIGGIDLGLERAGWECRFQVEWDHFCQRVLAKHWPDVPRYGDITAVDWSGVERVDLLAGGFPCQPFSVAGKQRRLDDDRWLWPEFARAIRELRPRLVLIENVPGLLTASGIQSRGCICSRIDRRRGQSDDHQERSLVLTAATASRCWAGCHRPRERFLVKASVGPTTSEYHGRTRTPP